MINRTLLLYAALSLLLLLAGCGQNALRLLYVAPPQNTIFATGSPQVCVVKVADGRLAKDLGARSNGTPFVSSDNVSEWVTHALGAELMRHGIQVSAAQTEAEALSKAGGAAILTSKVEEIWLAEKSSTSYTCSMRISVVLKKGGAVLASNSFNSSIEKRVVPLSDAGEEILKETLEELVRPVGLAVWQKLAP